MCTGLLLALTLPPLVPSWMALLGGAFAILIGKMIFGGLGYNLFNPALVGRAFMMASFPLAMSAGWAAPRPWFGAPLDAVTTATPLAALKEHGLAAAAPSARRTGEPWAALVARLPPGLDRRGLACVLVALGAAVLVARGIIRLTIPLERDRGRRARHRVQRGAGAPPAERRAVARRVLHGHRLRHLAQHARAARSCSGS